MFGCSHHHSELDGDKPLVVELSALFAARIGGASIGLYGDLSDTELDSRANMAVTGSGCTIIAKSGQYANVTPFSDELPVLER